MTSLPLPDPPLDDGVVKLRAWRLADAPALAAAWDDPEVARWTTAPTDRSERAARRWIEGASERRRRGLALDLVVEADETVAGEVGLARLDSERQLVEIGWWLAAGHRGRGLARRVVSLVAGWALRVLPVEQAYARIDPANLAAANVARGAGFERRGQASDGLVVWSRRR